MTGRPLSGGERAVLDAVDEAFVVRVLSDLVAVPSLPAAEQPAQELVASLLAESGADVDVFSLDVARLRAHPAFSTEHERPAPVGVTGAVGRADGGSTLLLNAHTDVVPAGDAAAWRHPPFVPTMVGRRLHGRGAADTKGGLAAAIGAVRALREAGVALSGRLLVDAVVGEEDGGCGTLGSLLHGTTADAAVVLEPTRLAVSPAVAGALTFHVTIRGRAAHGCLREEGVSAIERIHVVLTALADLERRRNTREADPLFERLDRPFAICVGRVEGGDWASSEADWARLEGRYGVGPDEDLSTARRELEEAVARAATSDPWLAGHPPAVEWVGAQFVPGRTDVAAPVVASLATAARDVRGCPTVIEGQPYGCDMGLLDRVGRIPTVVFGPGDIRQAHTVDEWVDVDEVVTAARVLALAAARRCA